MIVILTLYILSPWILSCFADRCKRSYLLLRLICSAFHLLLSYFTKVFYKLLCWAIHCFVGLLSHIILSTILLLSISLQDLQNSVSLLLLVSVPLLPDALNPFVSISLRGILKMGFFLGFTLFQLYYYNGVLQFNLTMDCSVMLCCQCHLQVLQATIFKLLVLKDHAFAEGPCWAINAVLQTYVWNAVLPLALCYAVLSHAALS